MIQFIIKKDKKNSTWKIYKEQISEGRSFLIRPIESVEMFQVEEKQVISFCLIPNKQNKSA